MAADRGPGPHTVPDGHDEASISETLHRLTGAAKQFAEAELALARKRGSIIAGAVRWIAILGAVAFIIAFGMIVTLMVGAILALAPYWGLGLSLLAVTGGALLAIILCALIIKGQVSRIKEGTR
ncbi:MAG TPA: phage holin family protein [Sphingobium sp.]|uniref:phage holin family protein n=1 Tax=Sphingobium sp. TaxID=1912891 RepID=UPI002ECFF64B